VKGGKKKKRKTSEVSADTSTPGKNEKGGEERREEKGKNLCYPQGPGYYSPGIRGHGMPKEWKK